MLVLITAGHCLNDSGLGATWKHNGVAIGTGYSFAFFNGANADAGAIHASESGARNIVYASSNTDIRSMTGTLSNASQPVGGLICKSGESSVGWKCNTVLQTNQDISNSGTLIHHAWRQSLVGIGGDSGGSMLLNYKWAGEFIAYTSTDSWYSTKDWVSSALSIYPCVVSNC